MVLPVPNLDDRRFQDLVDDAKRLVAQKCPEWTDHNVSDPGVTLIETFAWMTDQLLYRLNRVPDRLYVKFLELIGVSLFPPTAARTDETFWLTSALPETVRIPAGTQVATVRTETEEAIVFTTTADLAIVTSSMTRIGSMTDGKTFTDGADGTGPRHGHVLLLAGAQARRHAPDRSQPMRCPRACLRLEFACNIEGVGVDPNNPPLAWEAWDGEDWAACEVETDETGGLNRDGDVLLHVPSSHVASVIDQTRAGWIRARVLEAMEGQPAYSASPLVTALTASTIGGTVEAVNAELVQLEDLGFAEGTPGQVVMLERRPVVPGETPPSLEVFEDDDWQPWTLVEDFAGSSARTAISPSTSATGELRLGPAFASMTVASGPTARCPPRVPGCAFADYRTGGGQRGQRRPAAP